MYCRNCGKELSEGSFCKYCGEPTQTGSVKKETISFSETLTKICDWISVFGHDKLVNIFSWLAAAFGIINRVMHNEVEVVYYFLAQDDYFVLAEEARGTAITVICIHIILCGLLFADVWTKKILINKGAYVSFVITLLIQIMAILLRMPALY